MLICRPVAGCSSLSRQHNAKLTRKLSDQKSTSRIKTETSTLYTLWIPLLMQLEMETSTTLDIRGKCHPWDFLLPHHFHIIIVFC
jgi:hypothetical protein